LFGVEITARAAAQIETAAKWWVRNRPAAPDAIRVDFEEAVALLSHQPGVGATSRTRRYPDLRRIYLSRIRYHVYYQVKLDKIVIVAFWHASRGRGPRF